MSETLRGRKTLVIGRESGIARAITLAVRAEGGEVIVAGKDADKLATAYDDAGVSAETIDVTDEASIAAPSSH